MTSHRTWRGPMACICAAVAALLLASPLASQPAGSYPTGPVKIVVPFAAGGMLEGLARHLEKAARAELGQPLIIENRPGAGGRVGASVVKQAVPDGHTLLFTTIGTMTILPLIPPNPPFDAERDFKPLAAVTQQPLLVAVRPTLNVNSLAELVALAKAQPGKLNYGSPGAGSEPHLATARLLQTIGVDMVHVPYRGGGPAVIDFIGGRLDLVVLPEITLRPALETKNVTLLATLNARRLDNFPNVPSITELGHPGVVYTMTTALFAPTQTPPAVFERWHRLLPALQRDPDLLKSLRDTGSTLAVSDSGELTKAMTADRDEWTRIIRSLNLKLD